MVKLSHCCLLINPLVMLKHLMRKAASGNKCYIRLTGSWLHRTHNWLPNASEENYFVEIVSCRCDRNFVGFCRESAESHHRVSGKIFVQGLGLLWPLEDWRWGIPSKGFWYLNKVYKWRSVVFLKPLMQKMFIQHFGFPSGILLQQIISGNRRTTRDVN